MKDLLKKINRIFLLVGSFFLFGMMVLGVANIILRAFGHPIKGTFELMGFGGALVVGLSLGGTQQKRGHIEVSIFQDKLPFSFRRWIEGLSYLFSITFWALIAYKLFELALVLRSSGELSETLNIPYYPLVFVLALGVIFMLIILVYQALILRKKE